MRSWVVGILAVSAVAVPVGLGDSTAAQGAKGPDQGAAVSKDKDKDKDKGKGKGDPTTTPAPAPPAPAPAPAPAPPAPAAEKDKGKDKDKDKGKSDDKSSGTEPAGHSPAVPPAPPGASATPTVALDTPSLVPTLGQSVGVATAKGAVVVRTAGGRDVQPLASGAAAIPTGSRIDARAGTVELSTAVDAAGVSQTATFHGGIFEIRQDAGGLARIVLRGGDFSGCRARAGHAVAAKRRKPIRGLWGKDDHGRFQTRGKGAVGTVRGTRWLTQDFCDGTRTTVVEGSVAVRDLRKRTTIVVRAGHSYFARF
jgi:hypothetical protein